MNTYCKLHLFYPRVVKCVDWLQKDMPILSPSEIKILDIDDFYCRLFSYVFDHDTYEGHRWPKSVILSTGQKYYFEDWFIGNKATYTSKEQEQYRFL